MFLWCILAIHIFLPYYHLFLTLEVLGIGINPISQHTFYMCLYNPSTILSFIHMYIYRLIRSMSRIWLNIV